MAFAPPKRQGGSVRVVEAERDTARGIGGGARQRAVGGSGQRGRGWGTHGTQVRRVWGLAKACAGVFVCARAGGGRCVLFWFVLMLLCRFLFVSLSLFLLSCLLMLLLRRAWPMTFQKATRID